VILTEQVEQQRSQRELKQCFNVSVVWLTEITL